MGTDSAGIGSIRRPIFSPVHLKKPVEQPSEEECPREDQGNRSLLGKAFYEKAGPGDRDDFLKKYGLSDSLKTYVLGTGANGVNRHREVIDAFERSGDRCQLLALCGKNEVTLAELNRIKARAKVPFRGSARAFGFGNGSCSPECGLPVRPSREQG